MSYEEEAIAKAQARAAKTKGAAGLKEHHKTTVSYLNERILTFVMIIALIGLVVLWATVESTFMLYGSFIAVILLVIFWGILQLQRIKRVRQERRQQASKWNSDN